MDDESLLVFPTDFPIKMMGRDTPEFRVIVRTLIEAHAGPVGDEAVHESMSSKGNFVSVTITILATSQDQLDTIYRSLTAHDDVLLAL